MRKVLITFPFLLQIFFVFAQQNKIDSLRSLLKKDKEDTNKVNHLNKFGWELMYSNPDTSIVLGNQAVKLSEKIEWKKGIANSLGNLGFYNYLKGDFPKTLDYYFKALKTDEELFNSSSNGGRREGAKIGIAKRLSNIGIVYDDQGDYPKALDYYFKALKMAEELENKNGIAINLGNIGIVYRKQGNYPKALDYYFKALKIKEELGDKTGIAANLGNIGVVYYNQGDYLKALDYYFKALKMAEELGDKNRIAIWLGNIGSLYTTQGNYAEAETHLLDALKLDKEIGLLQYEMDVENNFTELYTKTNHFQLALEHYKKAIVLKDTLFNQEKNKEITRKEMNFEFEKKETAAKAAQDKKDAVTAEEKRRQKIITYAVSGGLFLVLLLALFIFRGYRQKQKANVIITQQKEEVEKQKELVEEQKKLVEEHNKDITDSINYAQRIQRALLASDSLLNKNLGEYFVLFKPKDIVSGDFYWATEKDGRFYLAVCDSTGHGGPGAFMSLLNISFLNEAITEKGIVQPNEIFNHVRQRLIENISSEGAKDGMDGILVCFEKLPSPMTTEREAKVGSVARGLGVRLSYAGANNAPYLMNDTLQELPTDNMPVGLGEKKDSFTHNTVSFQSGDILYLYTDGFADQFGGPKGKKFKYKPLNDLLSVSSDKPLAEQKIILEKTFVDWKGSLEQVDDVLVIGIKI